VRCFLLSPSSCYLCQKPWDHYFRYGFVNYCVGRSSVKSTSTNRDRRRPRRVQLISGYWFCSVRMSCSWRRSERCGTLRRAIVSCTCTACAQVWARCVQEATSHFSFLRAAAGLRRCSCRAGPPAPVEVAVLGLGWSILGFLPMAFTSRQIFCPSLSVSGPAARTSEILLLRCENSLWGTDCCRRFFTSSPSAQSSEAKTRPLLQTEYISEYIFRTSKMRILLLPRTRVTNLLPPYP
jgi:hypothetical protein